MKKRKVLIPLDGSTFSRQIVDVVRTFFEPNDVHLILLRAAYPPSVTSDVTASDAFSGGIPLAGSYDAYTKALDAEFSAATRERETYRKALVDEMRRDAELLREVGYVVRIEAHFGDPAQRIIEFVSDEDIDMVAMTTHGRTGLGRIVLGSVAERVLRGVTVPVLLLRSVEGEAVERNDTEGGSSAYTASNGHKP